jgi:hypothetical protein
MELGAKNMKPIVKDIPLYSEKTSRWTMKVDLSGVRYEFYISWNSTMDMWTMTISDQNGDLLLAGIRLVPGVSFFERYRASIPELPPGELWLTDLGKKTGSAEVTRDNLHTRFALNYTVWEE